MTWPQLRNARTAGTPGAGDGPGADCPPAQGSEPTPISDVGVRGCGKLILCCFKPLGLRCFLTAPLEASPHPPPRHPWMECGGLWSPSAAPAAMTGRVDGSQITSRLGSVSSMTHREVLRRPQLPGWWPGPLSWSAGFLCIRGDVLLPGPPVLGNRNGEEG